MPIYEYRCSDCGRVTSVFLRSVNSRVEPRCEHCNSRKLKRVMSKVGRRKTAQDVVDELGAPGLGARLEDQYKDPRQIGRWVEKRFEDYGVDIPDEIRQRIDAAREGELPGAVQDI